MFDTPNPDDSGHEDHDGEGLDRAGDATTAADATTVDDIATSGGTPDAGMAGLELAAVLDAVDPTAVGASELVELSALWSQVISWATARRSEAIAVLAEQAADVAKEAGQDEHWEDGRHAVATELSMAEGMTRQYAEKVVRSACLLNGMLMATGESLESGQITPVKADIIVEALAGVPYPVAWAVEERILPGARGWTPPELARQLQQALIAVDAHEADRRARRATERRRVCHPRVRADGMASIFAVLPAADAIAIDLALDGAARAAKQVAGETRTMDQLRADLLATIGVDALTTGTLAGASTAITGRVGWSTGSPAGATIPSGTGNMGCTCNGATPGVPLARQGGRPVQVHVTVPLTTLLGGGEPGELEGYGALAPATARTLAWGGTWKRLVTDPLTGTVLDVGRTSYRPPAALADLIRARDRTCVRPGCATSARACELDHLIPWEHDGTTSLANLAAQCTQDHRHKTLGDFTVNLLPGGVFEWASRLTGRAYRRESDGDITSIDHLTAENAPPPPPPPKADPNDVPPPF